jgi:hypothetical protein
MGAGVTLEPPELDWFWQLIDSAQLSRERLRVELSRLSKEDVHRFQDLFLELATELQDEPFTLYIDSAESEDGVADVAHWVVSQGRATYDSVLAEPARIPSRVEVGDPSDLSSVAYEVFHERFGEPLELL